MGYSVAAREGTLEKVTLAVWCWIQLQKGFSAQVIPGVNEIFVACSGGVKITGTRVHMSEAEDNLPSESPPEGHGERSISCRSRLRSHSRRDATTQTVAEGLMEKLLRDVLWFVLFKRSS